MTQGYPVLTGELAKWDNFQAALTSIQSFLTDAEELKNITSRFECLKVKKVIRPNNYIGLIINVETGIKFNGTLDLVSKTTFSKNSIYTSLSSSKALGMVNKETGEFIKIHGKWGPLKKLELTNAGFIPAHFVKG